MGIAVCVCPATVKIVDEKGELMSNDAYRIKDCPSEHADAKVTRWFADFCIAYFSATPVAKIYLTGSRVTGISSKGGSVRPNSDYDFYVVIRDTKPELKITGSALWEPLVDAVRNARAQVGIQRTIDALVCTESDFETSLHSEESHATKASREGFVVAEQVASGVMQAPPRV